MRYKLYWRNNSQKNIDDEIWLLLNTDDGHCWASNYGRIKRGGVVHPTKRGALRFWPAKVCKQYVSDRGYLKVLLWGKQRFVHRIVCLAFHERYEDNTEVNHKNGDKKNNLPDNLEWATKSQNIQHSHDYLNRKVPAFFFLSGEKNPNGRPIVQKTLDGTFIKKWNSITGAAKEVGTTKNNIYGCLIGKSKKAHGFKWEYL